MKILQCACILGAVAALYSLAQRVTVREPSLVGAETLAPGACLLTHGAAVQCQERSA